MNRIVLKPIGLVESPVRKQTDQNWGAEESRVVLLPEYDRGLKGLMDFSHALVPTWLHEAGLEPSRHLERRPRGLSDMPEVGIFSQRAKDRPNPIGLTATDHPHGAECTGGMRPRCNRRYAGDRRETLLPGL